MKRLGVFVSILMLSLGLFGGFSSMEKVHAQGTSSVATETQESLYAKGVAIFETAVTDTQAKKTTANTVGSDNFVKIINEGKDVYTKSFNDAITAKKDIYTSYNSALLVARQYIIDERKKDVAIMNQGVDSNTIFRNLQNAATARRNELLASGDTAGTAALDESTRRTQNAIIESGKNGGAPLTPKTECNLFNLGICVNDIVTWFIKNTLLQVGGFLVWLTANMFNYAVQMGVLQFSQWAPDALYPIWTIVRQIISLIIVFAGLYLGFMYILGKEDKFEKYIPWVIMFGLFVNFSYPLTRTLIDISNIVSLNIYASAVGPDALIQEFTSAKTAGGLIMIQLGLQSLVASAVTTKEMGILGEVNSIPGALVAVVYVFYAAYIFFQVTAIFVMRTLALVFIIIASPLLLVDSVLPMLGTKAKELRGIFFDQLIVGPVFMIMLALTLKFLDVFARAGPAMETIGGGVADGKNVVVFFNIMMMLGMLHIMIKVTKHFAGELGKRANEAFGAVSGIGLGMATGGLGLLGRQGIGRLAANAQSRGWVSKDPNSMSNRIANTLSTSSFDVRNSSIIAGAAGKLGMNRGILGMGGMGGGSASKASFQSNADAKAKRIEASAKARFKTKYERDTIDEEGKFRRKGEDNEKEIKKYQEFMASKSGSLFITKEQRQKFIDDETDAQADRSLSEYNKLKTEPEKVKRFKEIQQELAEAQKSDPKFETAKAQALRRTVEDIKKKTKEEDEVFAKEFDRNLAKYNALTGEKKKVYLEEQNVEEMRKSIETGKNLRAERRASENASTPTPTASPIPTSSTASPSSSSTPLVEDTDWSQLNSPAVNRREKATTSQAPITTTTATATPSSNSGSSPVPEEMVPFPTLDGAPSAPAPLTGEALRQERIKKVAEGRGAEVKKWEDTLKEDSNADIDAEAKQEIDKEIINSKREKQQNSATKALVFASTARLAERRAIRKINTPTPQSSTPVTTPAPQPTQQVEEEVTS